MAEKDIWEATKEGDLNRVKHLIEIQGINVDSKDKKGEFVINYSSIISLNLLFYFISFLFVREEMLFSMILFMVISKYCHIS